MSKDYSPENVLIRYKSAFPNGIGDLFYNLFNQVSALHVDWKNYRSLYGTSPERIALLNSSASSFFQHLERIMRHHIVMTIARLTDKAKIGNNENASLRKLLEMIQPHIDTNFFIELKTTLKNIESSCGKARALRNKILAHSDFANALHYISEPIQGISRAEIESMLAQIRLFMNKVELHFARSEVAYEHIMTNANAEQLLLVLKKADELRRE